MCIRDSNQHLVTGELARDQVLIVVTHEPELFQDWDCQRLRLRGGRLEPMTTLP